MDGWRDGLNRLWRDGVTILPRPAKKNATAKNNRPVPAFEKKKITPPRPVPSKKKKKATPSRLGEKKQPPRPASEKKTPSRPASKKKKPAPSRYEQQNTPPRGWKLETNTTACHLGIDATSCQAERNFSALSALLGDLQSNLGRRKVEMMMLLKLNQQLIPGLADVLQQVADLKDATAAGNVVSLS